MRTRSYMDGHFLCIRITVLRFICHSAKALRKSTGEEIQYTITILPPFLIPHAKISLVTLFKAFSHLSKTADMDHAVGTVSKEADSRMLNRFLSRFRGRFPQWFQKMCQWIVSSGMVLPAPDFSALGLQNRGFAELWKLFRQLSRKLSNFEESVTRNIIILRREQTIFAHARLAYAGMSLGP